MTLSDYELQVLQELEVQLRQPKHPRLARIRLILHAYESALVVGALAVTAVVAVFFLGAALAPVAGLLCGFTGSETARARHKLARRRDQPEPS